MCMSNPSHAKPIADTLLVFTRGLSLSQVPKGCYTNPKKIEVECDASSATYPLALAAITGGTVTCDAVGSSSIQGDAGFALLCRDMGCTVKQQPNKSTVSGPKGTGRLKAIDVDMEPMTDAFMTAVALAAVADGTTRITGIANQRVKECNRIEVMVTELAKIGIVAGELEDGIWVTGVDPNTFTPRPTVVSCHNDHRIAMSFAVLGSRISGITIGQKSCVDKTYPEFWSDTSRKLGVKYTSADAAPAAAAAGGPSEPMDVDGAEATHPSVVVIGMRGAGKTHLGTAAASALGATFLDLDWEYEKLHGKIMDTVNSEGWPTFRAREAALLKKTLSECSTGHVIACGGGVVETDEGRALLRAHWPVVQAVKPIGEIESYLGVDATRPSLGEPPRVAYERRKVWYDACADLDHLAAPGEGDYRRSEERLVKMLERVLGLAPPSPMPHESSFFLSLTYADLQAALPLADALWTNTDAVELRCDLLHSLEPAVVQGQIALLQAHCPLPIIFTIRSKSEGGAYEGGDEQYLALNEIALRAGCEWIDLEACRDGPPMQAFAARARARHARLIGSNHILGPMPSAAEIGKCLQRCELRRSVDVAKFVGVAKEPSHALHVHNAAAAAGLSMPYIALAMGPAGQMSRVLNDLYTPVTHPLLPFIAAPGQMSVAQILDARRAYGYLPKRTFHIFGNPTKYSPSPAMHNAAFGANGCAHVYGVCETEDVEVVLAELRKPNAGGGSVTIPLKEKLMPHVDVLSPSATAIGSLNTLTVRADGTLAADNTDWIGIRNLLVDNLAEKGLTKPKELTAIVMGGGGTARAACYALQQMRIGTFYVYNRSTDKAQALADEFGGKLMLDLNEGAAALDRLDLVVSCVPGAAGLSPPEGVLRSQKPIVLDAAYRPRETPLLANAAAAGCVVIEGIEMLFEQGCAQARIWTHRTAPRGAIVKGLQTFTDSQEFGPLPKRLVAELV